MSDRLANHSASLASTTGRTTTRSAARSGGGGVGREKVCDFRDGIRYTDRHFDKVPIEVESEDEPSPSWATIREPREAPVQGQREPLFLPEHSDSPEEDELAEDEDLEIDTVARASRRSRGKKPAKSSSRKQAISGGTTVTDISRPKVPQSVVGEQWLKGIWFSGSR